MSDIRDCRRMLPPSQQQIDDDIAAELDFHTEMREQDFLSAGLTLAEARAAARARLGDLERVAAELRTHDIRQLARERRVTMTRDIMVDVRAAIRQLSRRRQLTLAIVLLLGLGIGLATTMFSAVDAVLLKPLPLLNAHQLAVLPHVTVPFEGRRKRSVELADVQRLSGIAGAAAFAPGGLNMGGPERPRRVRVALVTPEFFELIGIMPARGRAISAREGTLDGTRVAVVSHEVWQSDLGADEAAIGRTIMLNGIAHEVIGVMAAGFGFPEATEIWVPLRLPLSTADLEPFSGVVPIVVMARLAPGIAPHSIGAQIVALERQLSSGSDVPAPASEYVVPLRDNLIGERRSVLLLLLGATGLVLLIACSNAINLLLARANVRGPEFTLRAALGATRVRLLREMLVESTMLSFLSAVAGIALAYAGIRSVAALLPPGLAGLIEPGIDGRVLLFSVLLAAGAALTCGLFAGWNAARAKALESLNAERATTGRRSVHTRRAIVVMEVALAVVLAVGTGLILRSLEALLGNEIGIQPAHVVTAEVSLPAAYYDTPALQRGFQNDVLANLAVSPGVEAAAIATRVPLVRGTGTDMIGYGVMAQGVPGRERVMAEGTHVSPDYFVAMGIPLLRGRMARPRVDSAAVGEIVISTELRRMMWRTADPIGAIVRVGDDSRVVVGVVGDVRSSTLEDEPLPQLYLPIEEKTLPTFVLIARGALPDAQVTELLRRAVADVDPQQPLFHVRPMDRIIASAVGPQRTTATLLTVFGALALALATIGVYAVLAYSVSQRRREIGIRMALGARSIEVVGLVMRDGLLMTLPGIMIGLTVAWLLRGIVESQLYGVQVSDPLSFACGVLAVLLASTLAALIPAQRAALLPAADTLRA